jgi:molybdopterin biosynthesis enzyme
VLQDLGGVLRFWKLRMRPGAPVGFGLLGEMPWVGLPGNPVSTMVTSVSAVDPGSTGGADQAEAETAALPSRHRERKGRNLGRAPHRTSRIRDSYLHGPGQCASGHSRRSI